MILGTGRQEIVSDLIKNCFKKKMEQKLEMTGQEKKKKKNMNWKKTQIPRRRRAMFCILNSDREKICFFLSRAVLNTNFHVRKEGPDKLQRKCITRNLKS